MSPHASNRSPSILFLGTSRKHSLDLARAIIGSAKPLLVAHLLDQAGAPSAFGATLGPSSLRCTQEWEVAVKSLIDKEIQWTIEHGAQSRTILIMDGVLDPNFPRRQFQKVRFKKWGDCIFSCVSQWDLVVLCITELLIIRPRVGDNLAQELVSLLQIKSILREMGRSSFQEIRSAVQLGSPTLPSLLSDCQCAVCSSSWYSVGSFHGYADRVFRRSALANPLIDQGHVCAGCGNLLCEKCFLTMERRCPICKSKYFSYALLLREESHLSPILVRKKKGVLRTITLAMLMIVLILTVLVMTIRAIS